VGALKLLVEREVTGKGVANDLAEVELMNNTPGCRKSKGTN